MRTLLLVLVLVAAAFPAGCGGGGTDYSDEATAEFMTRCGNIFSSAETCDCLLENFSDEDVSPEELELILSNLSAPVGQKQELPDDLVTKLTAASEPCMNDPFADPETQTE